LSHDHSQMQSIALLQFVTFFKLHHHSDDVMMTDMKRNKLFSHDLRTVVIIELYRIRIVQ